jgi:GNAT superfamily N-acetyltransferase
MQYVLGDTKQFEKQFRMLINFFVMNRVLKNEIMLGIRDSENLASAAIISIPHRKVEVPELKKLSKEIWEEIGSEAETRYKNFGNACDQFYEDVPQLHLNMIGVHPDFQRKGFGKKLLSHIHDLSKNDERSTGVSLTTEVPENVDYYKSLGYELVGKANIGNAFTTWNFFRKN